MKRSIGVLWDYNGVIANDEMLHETAFQEVLVQFGVQLTPQLYRECCLGRTDAAGFQELHSRFGSQLSVATIEEMVTMKQAAYQKVLVPNQILYPDALRVLGSLNGNHVCGIVTSSQRREVIPVVEYLEQYGVHFKAVVTADDIIQGKPCPDGYLKGLYTIGLPVSQVVVVEDSPSGVEAAKAARLVCIALRHTSPDERLRGADLIVPTIGDITMELIHDVLLQKKKSAVP